MEREVLITGLGPISGLGLGAQPTWEALCEGRQAIGELEKFDPAGFDCHLASEITDFKVRNHVPKSYRKATKVMARDIELAVAGADIAARDAGLITKGTDPDQAAAGDVSYPPLRMGVHIGAGLIAADTNELTAALNEARKDADDAEADPIANVGEFDLHKWGRAGMNNLTPLWLLKYLPNMLGCHVTIIHDAQGPSNTITCGEASSGLSVGESLRAIQRGQADACFSGGAESKLNPTAMIRQQLTGRLNAESNPPDGDPAQAVRPLDREAPGTVLGEGGGIVMLEAAETFQCRGGQNQAYARLSGYGASQSVNRAKRNQQPESDGRGIAAAIKAALGDAKLEARDIDLIVPLGLGCGPWDQAETSALRTVFGERLSDLPLLTPKASVGSMGAGAGGFDLALAACAVYHQHLPAVINRENPLEGLPANAPARDARITHALCCSPSVGGQNTAIILTRV